MESGTDITIESSPNIAAFNSYSFVGFTETIELYKTNSPGYYPLDKLDIGLADLAIFCCTLEPGRPPSITSVSPDFAFRRFLSFAKSSLLCEISFTSTTIFVSLTEIQ